MLKINDDIYEERDLEDEWIISQILHDVSQVKSLNCFKIWIAGGVGDLLAFESFMSPVEKESVEIIFNVGYRPKMLIPLFPLIFPNLKYHFNYWTCLGSKLRTAHFQQVLGKAKIIDSSIKNYLVAKFFNDIKSHSRPYQGSLLLSNQLADIHRFNLPKRYICVVPDTYNATAEFTFRKFQDKDWKSIGVAASKYKFSIVLLGVGNINLYGHDKSDNVINLVNKTTLLESLEIVRNGSGYIGTDTAFCVIAAKMLPKESVMIRSKNDHCYNNLYPYFAPHNDFSFVQRELCLERFKINDADI